MQVQFRKPDMERDLRPLFLMMTDDDQYLFSTRVLCNTERDFSSWLADRLRGDFHDFYVITASNAPTPIGFAYDYDFSLRDGHCKLCVYVSKEYRTIGLGGIAAVSFMDLLFNTYPIRKVYSTIYEYNQQSLQSNLRFGFIKEGTLEKFRYHNGQYHNLHYLSLSRQQFEKVRSNFMRR